MECEGVIRAGGIQTQLLQIEFQRIFSRLGSQNLERRAIGKDFIEAERAKLSHSALRIDGTAGPGFARWNVDLKSSHVNIGNSA